MLVLAVGVAVDGGELREIVGASALQIVVAYADEQRGPAEVRMSGGG